jgi:hypothetical protein
VSGQFLEAISRIAGGHEHRHLGAPRVDDLRQLDAVHIPRKAYVREDHRNPVAEILHDGEGSFRAAALDHVHVRLFQQNRGQGPLIIVIFDDQRYRA